MSRCPVTQLNSDTVHLELASQPAGSALRPTRQTPPHISPKSHIVIFTSAQEATNRGAHGPSLGSVIC